MPEPAVEPPLTLKDKYDYTARQILREERLINNRLSWMLTFEGFLFAALALTANASNEGVLRNSLKYTIPATGIAVAVLTMVGISGAYVSINQIKIFWGKQKGIKCFPLPYGSPQASARGRVTSHGIPLAMMLMWSLIYLFYIFQLIRQP